MAAGAVAIGVVSSIALSSNVAVAADDETVDPSVLNPIDPQNWENMDDMTWDDYTPVPGTDWAHQTEGSQRQFHGAIVMLDFENQPFLVTQDQGSHVFGNPSGLAHNIPREDVPDFYLNLLNEPNELNHGRTINEFWMEQTGGRLSVQMEAFGPYKLPGNIEEYGLNDSFNKDPDPNNPRQSTNAAYCPQGLSCNKNIRTDALALWGADLGVADPLTQFDEVFYVTAGHDESSTWEEFGQMIFEAPEDVTDDFGPPRDENGVALNQNGENMANWAKTRYIPWTSWAAAINHWPNANFASNGRAGNSTQAESSGMGTFAHEFSHILGISDNYGNPYGTEAADGGPLRDTAGPFDVLGRGSFNGPGGTHQRWGVPSVAGGSQPAGVALRNRLNLGLIDDSSVVNITRTDLAANGSIMVDLQSRALQEDGVPLGINLQLDGGDLSTGSCVRNGGQFDCDGGNYNNYTLEVIDRMGTDSFAPDHGVMLAKTKDQDRNPFIWTIDANPQDIATLDYTRPDGTPIPITRGDQRQLNDALFHAGINSGSEYEYVDEANRLHFYIADQYRDDRGILHYDVAVRSLDSAGPQARGVSIGDSTTVGTAEDGLVEFDLPVTNTGGAVTNPLANGDIYRVTTSVVGGDGSWSVQTPSEIVTATTGETINVPVYAVQGEAGPTARAAAIPAGTTVTVTITSENDPSATQTVSYVLPTADSTTPPTDGPTDPTDPGTTPGTDGSGAGDPSTPAGNAEGDLANTGADASYVPGLLIGTLAAVVIGSGLVAYGIRRNRRRTQA